MSFAATEKREPGDRRASAAQPRLGFLGVGWIGRNRMEAIANSGVASIAAIVDPSSRMTEAAQTVATDAEVLDSYEDLLDLDLDGIVIATPSAMHAEQAIAALQRGFAVFCQKPLACSAEDTRRVVNTARAFDRLLSVDLSYRNISGVPLIRDAVRSGGLGKVFAVDLVFHNAYGPDKPWFYDPEFSGGGCVIDLGIHLVDLASWVLGYPGVRNVSSQLLSGGGPSKGDSTQVEDFAAVQIELVDGTAVQLACSWNLNAGREAVIEASFYGTEGGAALRNVDGSFFDFTVERFNGTSKEMLSQPECGVTAVEGNWEWGGRAAIDWARRVSKGEGFDPECEHLIDVAEIIDRIYGRGRPS